jgi:hypothetical protein
LSRHPRISYFVPTKDWRLRNRQKHDVDRVSRDQRRVPID